MGQMERVTFNAITPMLEKYQVRIRFMEDEPDYPYVADVPELSGCHADGSTRKESLQNLMEVLADWPEAMKDVDREMPSPVLFEA